MSKGWTIRIMLVSVALLGVVFGWGQLFRFSATPGEQAAAPARWPHEEPRLGDGKRPFLMVFVHPRCDCTHATLLELDRILEGRGGSVQVALVVYQSRALDEQGGGSEFAPERWLRKPFTRIQDAGGVLARRFGAATSGEAVLYSSEGKLLFQGGVTPERAHVGDSQGASKLNAALRLGVAQTGQTNVFGCPLF